MSVMKVAFSRSAGKPVACSIQRPRRCTWEASSVPGLGRSQSCRSHNPRADLQLGWPFDDEPCMAYAAPHDPPAVIDVLGLGQAMVDLQATIAESVLEELEVDKGARKIISVEERSHVLAGMDESGYSVSAGGSLSNTLMGLARLGSASSTLGARRLSVAMGGLVGSDALGDFYGAQMRRAGVEVLAEPVEGAYTGTVLVLTTGDAQRTMLSYLGTSCEIPFDTRLEAAIARTRVLVVEGYLWELPGAAEVIGKAISVAQRHGAIVAMTAGDAGVVQRHHAEMWEAIDRGIDLLFTNKSEAEALVQYEPPAQQQQQWGPAAHSHPLPAAGTAEEAALRLGPHCSLVCVTDSSRGAVLAALGQLHTVPPCWAPTKPVDTCGAGDAFAAGLLYAFLRGYDVTSMGRTAARVASAVISQMGAALSTEAAHSLALQLPLGADRDALRGGGLAAGLEQQQQRPAPELDAA